MVMKRFILLMLLMTLASGTVRAGVRLDWDDSFGSTTGAPVLSITSGGTGGQLSALALGEVDAAVQTTSLTFFLPGTESGAIQTPSLTARLESSHSTALTLDTLTFDASGSSTADASIVLYEWDADGDGIFDASTTTPTWETAFKDNGTFLARVQITDESGQSDLSDPLRVVIFNRAPVSNFEMSVDTAYEGSLIGFSDLSRDDDGNIISRVYDFGDGTSSSEANPSHAYATAGTYQVSLAVTDNDGILSEKIVEIEILNLGPQAKFTPQRSTLNAGQQLIILDASIDPSVDGAIVHVAWDFGDGTYLVGGPSSDDVYSHTFSLPGTYTIELYVVDNDGGMARAQSIVTVL